MPKKPNTDKNEYFLLSDEAVIICPDETGTLRLVFVDREDLDRVIEFGFWRVYRFESRGTWQGDYAYVGRSGKMIYLHRFVMDAPKGSIVDHINRNSLDNRRKVNLRVTTHAVNMLNKVGGVSFSPNRKKNPWVARMGFQGKDRYLGSCPTREEAQARVDFFRAQCIEISVQ